MLRTSRPMRICRSGSISICRLTCVVGNRSPCRRASAARSSRGGDGYAVAQPPDNPDEVRGPQVRWTNARDGEQLPDVDGRSAGAVETWRRRQRPSPMTIDEGVVASASTNVRRASGVTPRTLKNPDVTLNKPKVKLFLNCPEDGWCDVPRDLRKKTSALRGSAVNRACQGAVNVYVGPGKVC